MTMTTEQIKTALSEDLCMSELRILWNEYCDDTNNPDDIIWSNDPDTLNEMLSGMEPMEVLRCAQFGNYNVGDDYFCFDGYGNLASFDTERDDECPMDLGALASWLQDREDLLEKYDLLPEEDDSEEEE